MTADYTVNGGTMLTSLKGGFDTESSALFEKEICAKLKGITALIIDMSGVDYISSSGLRTLLYLQQTMEDCGVMKVRNPSENVNVIFDVTGFEEIIEVIREDLT